MTLTAPEQTGSGLAGRAARTVPVLREHAAGQEESRRLHEETSTLAGSLNSSTTRGVWGETQLRRILEHAGFTRIHLAPGERHQAQ